MAVVTGTVSTSVTKERIAKASAEARQGAVTKHEVADDYGVFSFDDLENGDWSFVALNEDSVPGRSKKLKVPDQTKGGVWLSVVRKETIEDRKAGRLFFAGLLLAFGLLVILYVALHIRFQQGAAPLSEIIPVAISAFEEQLAAAFEAEDKAAKAAEGAELLAAMGDIATGVETALDQRVDMSETDRLLLLAQVKAIEDSLAEDKVAVTLADAEKSELPERITVLRETIKMPGQRGAGIWERDPLRIIEVLLWGLAGVLVNKIIDTGWYLRRRSFHKEGIIMHVAHIVATPVMVLVVVFLLSLVSLEITLAAGNTLTLDLSDPRVMVAFSFLLGTIPWPLWNFIERTANKFPSAINA